MAVNLGSAEPASCRPVGPPTTVTERALRGNDRILYALATGMAATVLLLAGEYWLSLPLDAFTIVVTLAVCHTLAVQVLAWASLPIMRRPAARDPSPNLRVGVATTFVAGAESPGMLERTVRALTAMEYPHETWVLDESDDASVRQLCERLGVHHFSRRYRHEYRTEHGPLAVGTKHGNYNAWLREIGWDRYDVIVGFDPDHIPRPDFLTASLGYFADPWVGYVQSPQVFYNQPASFIARGAAEETYGYYSITQMASFAWGYPIIVGAHHCHRTAALRDVGGFPAHDAEDIVITLCYRSAGWRGVYVPRVLTRGLAPVDWHGYLRQQSRWARSVADIKLRTPTQVRRSLPRREWLLSMLHGINYLRPLWNGVALLVLLLLLLTAATPPAITWATAGWLGLILATGMGLDAFRQRFYLEPRRERGLRWRAVLLGHAKWPYFLIAVFDALTGRKRPYVITAKVDAASGRSRLLRPHLVAAAFVAAAWLGGVLVGHEYHLLVRLWAAATIGIYAVLAWSETWRFPAPYDATLTANADSEPNSPWIAVARR